MIDVCIFVGIKIKRLLKVRNTWSFFFALSWTNSPINGEKTKEGDNVNFLYLPEVSKTHRKAWAIDGGRLKSSFNSYIFGWFRWATIYDESNYYIITKNIALSVLLDNNKDVRTSYAYILVAFVSHTDLSSFTVASCNKTQVSSRKWCTAHHSRVF